MRSLRKPHNFGLAQLFKLNMAAVNPRVIPEACHFAVVALLEWRIQRRKRRFWASAIFQTRKELDSYHTLVQENLLYKQTKRSNSSMKEAMSPTSSVGVHSDIFFITMIAC